MSFFAVLAADRSAAAQGALPLSPQERAQSVILSDGKGHYLAVLPLGTDSRHEVYYSPDGQKFYEQAIVSSGGEVGKHASYLFADPRYESLGHFTSSLEFKEGKYAVTCGERTVALQTLSTPEAQAKLAAATLAPSPRKWRPYALARDAAGKYYYIDRGRTKATESNFRIFVGPKGALVERQMTNIVSDSEGDIFATKGGSLRLLLGKNETQWVVKNKATRLTIVPVEDNVAMIFNDLGVYVGQKMGTPCDDL